MIYLVTGVPGSGKTLYAVSTLIRSLMADKIKQDDGTLLERRLCVDGIKDLAIDHEELTPSVVDDKGVVTCQDGHGVANWFEWCKPGDLIVIDEVQRYWRPRSLGTRPPMHVQKLETHRHQGVDFVLITQRPGQIDSNVRGHVGRHMHLRRLFGGARSIIYEWDGCQTATERVKEATKTYWAYPKDAYKLYTSSVLHIKQKHKLPAWMLVPVIALALGVGVLPKAMEVFTRATTGKTVVERDVKALTTQTGSHPAAPVPIAPVPVVASAVASANTDRSEKEDKPEVSGCAVVRNVCKCFDTGGRSVPVVEEMCLTGLPSKTASELKAVPSLDRFEDPVDRRDSDERLGESIKFARTYALELNRVLPRESPWVPPFRF